MWKYDLAETVYGLNEYIEKGYEFVCTRRHIDGFDEFLVRKFKVDEADLKAPFCPTKQEWVVPVPGQHYPGRQRGVPEQARWFQTPPQRREDETQTP